VFSGNKLADRKPRESLAGGLIRRLNTELLRNLFNFRRFLNDNSLFLISIGISAVNRFVVNYQQYSKCNRKRRKIISFIYRKNTDLITLDFRSAAKN
jgi:hypothetical protein